MFDVRKQEFNEDCDQCGKVTALVRFDVADKTFYLCLHCTKGLQWKIAEVVR